MNKDRKSTVKRSVFAVIILALLVALIGGTYARYSSQFKGNTTADIAKWSVKVNKQAEQTFTPSFTYVENNFVADNKLAPERSMSADIEIDLTGTEVAVDAIVKIDTTQLAEKIGTSKITATALIDGEDATQESGKLIELPSKSAFTEENGKKTVKMTITWKNEDAQNVSDTKIGTSEENLSIPVTITLQQHIQPSEAA